MALDSCQSVGKLSDRKHSSLICMGTEIKKGLSEESVVQLIQLRLSAVTSYVLSFSGFTIVNCFIIQLLTSMR